MKSKFLLFFGIFIFLSHWCLAVIMSMGHEDILFSKDSISKEVIRSSEFQLTDEGLISPKDSGLRLYKLWIQTQKVSAGLGWRPPSSVNLGIAINGSIGTTPIVKDYVIQQYFHVFVHYGCDGVHWSDWVYIPQDFDTTSRFKKNYQYDTDLGIPSSSRTLYDSLREEWLKTNPDWSSDEDEYCHWLVKKKPDFFNKEIPFIGYLQFRIEADTVRGQIKIKSISIDNSWGVGGITSIPKKGQIIDAEKDKTKWNFDVSKKEKDR